MMSNTKVWWCLHKTESLEASFLIVELWFQVYSQLQHWYCVGLINWLTDWLTDSFIHSFIVLGGFSSRDYSLSVIFWYFLNFEFSDIFWIFSVCLLFSDYYLSVSRCLWSKWNGGKNRELDKRTEETKEGGRTAEEKTGKEKVEVGRRETQTKAQGIFHLA